MQSRTQTYEASLVSTAPMAYVINSSVANSVLHQVKPATESIHDQIARLQEQNHTLQRKLHNKTMETAKFVAKIEKSDKELTMYRQILETVNRKLINGERPPAINLALQTAFATSKAKQSRANKSASTKVKPEPTCPCCYVAEKPYICEYNNCGKRFRQKQHLEAHSNVHTGRRFTCEWPNCDKSFCRRFNLMEHAKMHSVGNPNLCSYPGCGKTFASKYGLQRHQSVQHQLNL